jgi:hypothetical protein
MKPSPEALRRYRLSYIARKKGIKVNGYKHRIIIHFNQISQLLNTPEAVALIKEYNFEIVPDKQLKLF